MVITKILVMLCSSEYCIVACEQDALIVCNYSSCRWLSGINLGQLLPIVVSI